MNNINNNSYFLSGSPVFNANSEPHGTKRKAEEDISDRPEKITRIEDKISRYDELAEELHFNVRRLENINQFVSYFAKICFLDELELNRVNFAEFFALFENYLPCIGSQIDKEDSKPILKNILIAVWKQISSRAYAERAILAERIRLLLSEHGCFDISLNDPEELEKDLIIYESTRLFQRINLFLETSKISKKIAQSQVDDIPELLDSNLRFILSQTEDPDTAPVLQSALLVLSKRVSYSAKDVEDHDMAHKLMSIARGIFNPEPKPDWEELPDELWSNIILPELIKVEDLGACISVSTKLSQLTVTAFGNWVAQNQLSLTVYKSKTIDAVLSHVIHDKLKTADFINYKINEEQLEELWKNCPQISSLFLKNSQTTRIFEFENLKILSIQMCQEIEADNFAHILAKLKNLEVLVLQYCGQTIGDKFLDILPMLSKLKELTLTESAHLSSEKLIESICKLKNLTYLRLDENDLNDGDKLAKVLLQNTNLETLSLGMNCNLTGKKLPEALAMLKNLRKLNLWGCQEIPGYPLILALAELKQLTSLDLQACYQIPGDRLAEVLAELKQLKKLNLTECYQIPGDRLLIALAELKHLVKLNLEGCDENMTDDQFITTFSQLVNLKYLNLFRCSGVNVSMLTTVLPRLKKLKKLVMPSQITNMEFEILQEQFPNITFETLEYSSEED